MRTSHSSMRTRSPSLPLFPVKGSHLERPICTFLFHRSVKCNALCILRSSRSVSTHRPKRLSTLQVIRLHGRFSYIPRTRSSESRRRFTCSYSSHSTCSSMHSPFRARRRLDKSLVLYASSIHHCSLLNSPFRHQSDIYRLCHHHTRWP